MRHRRVLRGVLPMLLLELLRRSGPTGALLTHSLCSSLLLARRILRGTDGSERLAVLSGLLGGGGVAEDPVGPEEELVEVDVALLVVQLVRHGPPEDAREEAVRHEGQVVAGVGLAQEVDHHHVVQCAREWVLEAPGGEVLHEDVDEDLHARVQERVLHRLNGVVRRRLGGAPHVVARVHLAPAARSQLVEGEVEGVEERVVQKDAERELRDDPAPRRHAGAVREHVGGRRSVQQLAEAELMVDVNRAEVRQGGHDRLPPLCGEAAERPLRRRPIEPVHTRVDHQVYALEEEDKGHKAAHCERGLKHAVVREGA
mmetsp:Transcript_26461/g.84808  ORF Transcript_26461/g.84808 Transcript_26461/m.84808 type:complete len:314 (+) Transcript_26461:145-1086(+)